MIPNSPELLARIRACAAHLKNYSNMMEARVNFKSALAK
jgi:hypothetical protein